MVDLSNQKARPWIQRVWEIFGDGMRTLGVFVPSRRALRMIPDNESLFGEQITTQRRSTIAYNSAFGLSGLRHTTTAVGTGSASDATKGKIILSTGTSAGSSYKLALSEVGVYSPGNDAEIGLGVRPQQALAGTAVARWGGLSASGSDGFYFKDKANSEVCAVRRKDDVEVDEVPRSEWNLDRFDGSEGRFNPSKINMDIEDGYIWQIDFTWYGYGIIAFGVVRAVPDAIEKQRFIPGHILQVDGDISISEPNLQVFADIDNGDQATDFKLDVGGMQYNVLGDGEGQRKRKVDDFVSEVTSVGTTQVHLISFRRKTDFLNRSVELATLNLVAASERMVFEAWIGGTVTGGTWATPTNYTAAETSVEVKKQQTFDDTDAILIDRFIVEAGDANKPGNPSDPVVDLDLPDTLILTLTARTLANTGTVSLAQVKLLEGW